MARSSFVFSPPRVSGSQAQSEQTAKLGELIARSHTPAQVPDSAAHARASSSDSTAAHAPARLSEASVSAISLCKSAALKMEWDEDTTDDDANRFAKVTAKLNAVSPTMLKRANGLVAIESVRADDAKLAKGLVRALP